MSDILPRSFFERSSIQVARDLLGKRLVRREGGLRLAGYILETEAYQGEQDLACHARAGLTPRTRVMYGPAGIAYVYFTYGAHWMLNAVTEPENHPSAVLIRAILPVEGLERIAQLRPLPKKRSLPTNNSVIPGWTDGPAKLTQALAIDGHFNGVDLCTPDHNLWVENGITIPDLDVSTSPRIGIDSVPEPWKSMPWRFLARLKTNLPDRSTEPINP